MSNHVITSNWLVKRERERKKPYIWGVGVIRPCEGNLENIFSMFLLVSFQCALSALFFFPRSGGCSYSLFFFLSFCCYTYFSIFQIQQHDARISSFLVFDLFLFSLTGTCSLLFGLCAHFCYVSCSGSGGCASAPPHCVTLYARSGRAAHI